MINDFMLSLVTERRKLAAFILISMSVFLVLGFSVFNNRSFPNDNIEYFFQALENPKALRFYGSLSSFGNTLQIEVESGSVTKTACYSIGAEMKRISQCTPDITITLDEHAFGSLIRADYYAKGTLASEYLFGHVKIRGVSPLSLLRLLWR